MWKYLSGMSKRVEPFGVSFRQNMREVHSMRESHIGLVDRLKRGDPEAFSELIRTYQDRVFGLVCRFLGAGDHETEDIAQEAFIRAYTRIHTFHGEASLGTWLYRITCNICLDHLRRRQREAARFCAEEAAIGRRGLAPTVQLDNRAGPESATEERELRDEIGRALMRLSTDHRLVLVLHDMEDLTYEEVARIASCRVGTVKSRLFYARQQMRLLLAEYTGQGGQENAMPKG